jgi:type VI secretion system secreted protein Hcp
MATHMFIKLDDVTGDSLDTNHADEIEVLSWSHSFNQPTSPVRSSAGGGTTEQANHSDFSFTKYLDAATDDLLKKCWTGKQIPKATFTAFRADGDTAPVKYLEVELQHVIVSNISVGGGGGDIPVENVSLAYGIVKYNYIPQKETDGTGGDNQPVQHDLEKHEVS